MTVPVDSEELWRRQGVDPWEFRVTFGTTRIEFDENKEMINRRKQGYSLESAVAFLKDLAFPFGGLKRPMVTSDAFREDNEVRHMHMTVDDSSHVVLMVTTMRPNETVRVISYRRASKSEAEVFFVNTGYRETS